MKHNRSFIYLLAIGALSSVLVRYLLKGLWPENQFPAFLAMISCVACMAIYARIIWNDHGNRSGNAENLYYMGFLFTLVSLIYSLIILFVLDIERDVDDRVYNLIGSFGIALFSTLFGILLRILLLQNDHKERSGFVFGSEPLSRSMGSGTAGSMPTDMSHELGGMGPGTAGSMPIDMSHELGGMVSDAVRFAPIDMNRELVEAAFKLRMILHQTTADMRSFCMTVQQAADETRDGIEKATSKARDGIDEATAQMVQHTEAVQQAINKTVDETVRHVIDKTKTMIEEAGSMISQSSVVATEQMQAAVKDQGDMLGVLSTKINRSGEKLEAAAAALERATAKCNDLADGTEAFTTAAATLGPVTARYGEFIDKSEESAKALTDATAILTDSVKDISQTTPEIAAQIEKSAAALRHEVKEWQSMTKGAGTSLKRTIKKFTELEEAIAERNAFSESRSRDKEVNVALRRVVNSLARRVGRK